MYQNNLFFPRDYSLNLKKTNSLNQYTNVDTTFSPTYDADGNQTRIKTTTGIWNVTYNGENRPVKFIQSDTVISMNYDYMGRRFEKIVIGEGNIETSQKFMYDDYLQIEELNGNNESIKSYLWDPIAEDASRPLMLTDHALEQSFFFAHDANKNVTDLIDEGGMVAVHYEYSPFGAITLNTNPSFYNSFTFSSEYSDVELDLIYYNYRHYNPTDGRWLSRDPIEEKGGFNLYGMVGNNSINIIDIFGLKTETVKNELIEGNITIIWYETVDGVNPTTGMVTKTNQERWFKIKYIVDVALLYDDETCTYSANFNIHGLNIEDMDWYSFLWDYGVKIKIPGIPIKAGADRDYELSQDGNSKISKECNTYKFEQNIKIDEFISLAESYGKKVRALISTHSKIIQISYPVPPC